MIQTAKQYDSTEGMSDACADGLRNLLTACADTKLMLGYHYGEWTFGPPELEAAIAGCSLCQTELGHVRLLHGLLKRHYGADPVQLVEGRKPGEFASISYLDRDLTDWAELVAANYVVDLALTRLLHSLKGSSFAPLRMSLEKMLDEERYHIHHGQGWFRTLCGKSEECRRSAEAAVNRALASAKEWFGPANEPEDEALVEAAVKSKTNPEVFADLVSDIEQVAAPLGVRIEVAGAAPDGWSPRTRRAQGTGPSDDILYHLRGSKNAVFKLKQ
jgi:ring-1,2-phenylacetyl-CoA epoxidase subunit PaaC